METPSFAATTGRGCGPLRRSSAQPLGRIGLQRVQLAARDDALLELGGGGSRYTPSFFAAVAGFMVWVVWCDVMVSRVSSACGPPTTAGSLAG